MKENTQYIGLDVHKETISVARCVGRDGAVEFVKTIQNTESAIRKLLGELGPSKTLRCCYEASVCGFAVYWVITAMGAHCDVIAPTLIPQKAGQKVKTDRRDAEALARYYRNGDLTPVFVPDAAHEALRDVVRVREAAVVDALRAKHRVLKYLLRNGRKPEAKMKSFGAAHQAWLRAQVFTEPHAQLAYSELLEEAMRQMARVERMTAHVLEAIQTAPEVLQAVIAGLQSLRGVAAISAVTIAVEVGHFSRFPSAKALMAYAGLVPREHSSGDTRRQGGITKSGNPRIRRSLTESAWLCRFRPQVGPALRKRQEGQDRAIIDIAWKAQQRLHSKSVRMSLRSKPPSKTVTAVARELLGFMWDIGRTVESTANAKAQKAPSTQR